LMKALLHKVQWKTNVTNLQVNNSQNYSTVIVQTSDIGLL
jgi:hypothetical protein